MKAGLAVLLALVACGSSEDDEAQHSNECSTGPEYAADHVFESRILENANALPACIPHCAAATPLTVAALPSGSCSFNGYECGLTISPSSGDSSPYECVCEGASWSCYVLR